MRVDVRQLETEADGAIGLRVRLRDRLAGIGRRGLLDGARERAIDWRATTERGRAAPIAGSPTRT